MATALDISTPNCTIEQDGHVLIVTLNRPEAKNALSGQMILGMYNAWRRLDSDPSLRVAVLTGKGDTFCSGMDLKAGPEGDKDAAMVQQKMQEIPDLHWQALLRHCQPMKPIIMAVEGYALAGGTEILLGTDLRIASSAATFGLTEVRRGIIPAGGSLVRLARQIPYTAAMEIILGGEPVTAEAAYRYGLVNRVVAPDDVLPVSRDTALRVAKGAPVALRKAKEAVVRTSGLPLADAYKIESACAAEVMRTEDAREGPLSFLEKREPVWKGA